MTTKIKFTLRDGSSQVADAEVGMSVMKVATYHDVPGIDGECGGELSCATCHVYLLDQSAFHAIRPDESDLLDALDDREENSRLSCQLIVKDDTPDVEVAIP